MSASNVCCENLKQEPEHGSYWILKATMTLMASIGKIDRIVLHLWLEKKKIPRGFQEQATGMLQMTESSDPIFVVMKSTFVLRHSV